ncbi:MAG: PAS domain-containing protein [Nannocystaceae bacterium]
MTWTEGAYRLLGLDPHAGVPCRESLLRMVATGDRPHAFEWAAACHDGRPPEPIELRVTTSGAEARVVRLQAEAVVSPDGVVRTVVGTAQDITPHRERATRLLQHNEQLELVIEGTRLGFWDWNPRTNEAHFSPRWAQMLGYDPEDIAPRMEACRSLVHPDDVAACDQAMREHLLGRRPYFEVVHRMRHAEGRWIYVLNRGKVFERDDSGQATRFCGTHADITAEKEAERLAIEANQAKTYFLANMSHELRTPLNAVLGLSEALLERVYGDLTDKQDRSLRTIHDSGRHLLDLINDVLDIARIEAGRLPVQPRSIGLQQLVLGCVALVSETIEAKQQRLVIDVSPELDRVDADPRRLKQILVNLLTNANKFSPEGASIEIGSRGFPDERRLELWVTNTGVEISRANQERIFEPFVSIDGTLARQHRGAGLGLALVKYLVGQHDGTVKVHSDPVQGVSFVVSMPWDPQRHANEPRSKAPDPAPERPTGNVEVARRASVLLVDDDEANLMAIGDYLESRGHPLKITRDGASAVTAAMDPSVDLVLMEIQIPQLHGLQAIEKIRATARGRAMPIVVLTASAMPQDEARCLAAGATAYFSKPIRLQELGAAIERLIPVEAVT